jgi:hypothetical protein
MRERTINHPILNIHSDSGEMDANLEEGELGVKAVSIIAEL